MDEIWHDLVLSRTYKTVPGSASAAVLSVLCLDCIYFIVLKLLEWCTYSNGVRCDLFRCCPTAEVALSASATSAVASRDSSSVKAFNGLKSAIMFSSKSETLSSIQNGSRVQCMQVR